MASITVRDLDDVLKKKLRLRAAEHSRSMEEEARQILRAALQGDDDSGAALYARIRADFAGLGDVVLPIEPREPMRSPPTFKAPEARDDIAPRQPAARRKKAGTP